VREATDEVCIFEHDLVFFPVHQKDHWRLIAVDFRNMKLVCYDSMKQDNDECLKVRVNVFVINNSLHISLMYLSSQLHNSLSLGCIFSAYPEISLQRVYIQKERVFG